MLVRCFVELVVCDVIDALVVELVDSLDLVVVDFLVVLVFVVVDFFVVLVFVVVVLLVVDVRLQKRKLYSITSVVLLSKFYRKTHKSIHLG